MGVIVTFPSPSSVMGAASNLIEAGERFAKSRQHIDRKADEMRDRFARNQQAYWAAKDREASNDDGPSAA